MRPAPAPRKALAASIAFEAALAAARLGLCTTGDEGGQPIDARIGDNGLRLGLGLILWLRLRLVLRLRTMVAFAMLTRLVLALIGLVVARLVIALAIAVAHEGLLLRRRLRNEARLLAEIREILAVVLAVVAGAADGLVATRLLVLAELFLGRRDQAEIMLGVLVVILGCDGVAGGARIARELEIFLGNVRGGAADLDVGAVRFVDPGHRVLAAPVVVVIVIIVAVAHPLLVLTVSHILPLIPALKIARLINC